MVFFFFFKQKTAYEMRISDWSSDVCSSDLTDNLEQRIAQHQSGEIAGYTQKRRPVSLVWQQDFGTRDEALSAEQQIKGWSRKQKEALIAADWDMISQLASKSFDTGLRQRSEERRVGIEYGGTCRSRWSADHLKRKKR